MKGDGMDIENFISNEKSLVRNQKYRELVADDLTKKYCAVLGAQLLDAY